MSSPKPAKVGAGLELKQRIEDEYKNWMVAAPQIYDVCMAKRLKWPSLTCEWLPGFLESPVEGWNRHQLLLGTHTDGDERNELLIARVDLPDVDTEIDTSKDFGRDTCEVVLRLAHPGGEVNRARHCPQRPTLIATRPAAAACCVFDTEKAAAEADAAKRGPAIMLRGHGEEGYGLAWNPHVPGELYTVANDGTLCGWDVAAAAGDATTPSWFAQASEVALSDVAFTPRDPWTLGAVGDDRAVKLWDTRKPDGPALARAGAHAADVNAIAFPTFAGDDAAPASLFRFLTGSADRTVKLWDMRQLAEPLHVFSDFDGDVLQVQWSPHETDVFAAAGADRRVTFFDVSRVGAARRRRATAPGGDDDDDARRRSSEDNFLQVWCIGEHIFEDEDEGAPQPPKPPTPQPSPAKRNAPASPGKSLVESVCSAMPVPSPAKKVKVIGGDDAKEDA
ncbi:histone-binding protein [Aureococcus anophagefferens]|uniref:Histone-binding protein n=1 Tax=Aureococcus anophagefferens TaxID=44056 RepID=A0ABR1FUL3_AURAN